MESVIKTTDDNGAPADADPARVSLRALYAKAMQDVMSDPQKAIAEYDPWLAALLSARPKAPAA